MKEPQSRRQDPKDEREGLPVLSTEAGEPALPLAAASSQLEAARGPKFWRSFEELAETPEFEELLHREFPRQAAEWDSRFDRREFLGLAGASLGLAGLTACSRQPPEKIVPYVRQPENLVPGRPMFFATALSQQGFGMGVLAESHLGRPTKIEGNPDHPASLGGADIYAQAAVRDLYDPDRSQALTELGKIRTWGAFLDTIGPKMEALAALGGEGLRVLTGTVTSPTLASLLQQLLAEMPNARWHQFEPAGRDPMREGLRRAFGAPADLRYDLKKADVVLAVDGDFLTSGPGAVRYAKDFASRRKVTSAEQAKAMSRLYSVESMPTSLSSVADHRLPLKPTEVGHFVLALAAQLGVPGATTPVGFGDGERLAWVEEVAADLEAHRGSSLVVVGEQVDPAVQTVAHAINDFLGNVGATVIYTEPVEAEPVDQGASFSELLADMDAGNVDTLVILGANPVYGSLADQDVVSALDKVRLRIHLGQYADETAEHCQWHIPEAHALESWTDVRAFDGTASIAQPLVMPLYGGKTAVEVAAALLGLGTVPGDELIQETWELEWKSRAGEGEPTGDGEPAGDFESFWQRCLHDGLVPGSAAAEKAVALDAGAVAEAAGQIASASVGDLELSFRLDPSVLDGRYANNAWLQECPKPMSKLTWDNALLLSPQTARDLGFGELFDYGDQRGQTPVAKVSVGDRALDVAIWAMPGQPDGTLTLHLGYGRTLAGKVGTGVGFDANQLRTTAHPWQVTEGVTVQYTGSTYLLASTQDHFSMEGRDLVRMAEVADFEKDPENPLHIHHHFDTTKTLMSEEEFPYDGYAWGMSIDLTSCTGCNACLVACQAENNIPSVGKDQVSKGREMHWIRVDRYFAGPDADHIDTVVNQPVPCMQCEQAPCEVVCPVAATVHSDEGLNDMVYNRCVGTRYCSNNCPYKVRRFNFLLYQDFETPSLQLGRNPDVSVRSRGVMEKCTYCVQRINGARIAAKRDDRKIQDGEIVTACEGACPSDAIVFGDINDPDSRVSRAKASPLDYSLLEELGNRPRTTYLGRIRNPNPSLVHRVEPTSAGEPDSHGTGH